MCHPVLPSLPSPIRRSHQAQTNNSRITKLDPRADVRVCGGGAVEKAMLASEVMGNCISLSPSTCQTLLQLGAVWSEQARLRKDSIIAPNGRVFVYVSPRRFPQATAVCWRERILQETEDYVVVNKPGGVPSIPRADNAYESCAECVERELSAHVHILHRLDIPTHGLMVFAKTTRFKAHFYREMRARKVHKRYKALVLASSSSSAPPPLAVVTHYMQPSTYSPKVLSSSPRHGWLECRLRIVAVSRLYEHDLSPVAANLARRAFRKTGVRGGGGGRNDAEERHEGQEWEEWEEGGQSLGGGGAGENAPDKGDRLFEVEIELLTGRTHQIRAQMSGMPVLVGLCLPLEWVSFVRSSSRMCVLSTLFTCAVYNLLLLP